MRLVVVTQQLFDEHEEHAWTARRRAAAGAHAGSCPQKGVNESAEQFSNGSAMAPGPTLVTEGDAPVRLEQNADGEAQCLGICSKRGTGERRSLALAKKS